MKRQSWIILSVCLLIVAGLGISYLTSRGGTGPITKDEAIAMTQTIERAFRNKNANGIMACISPAPDTRIANLSSDQLRAMLVRYFRNADQISADLTNYMFEGGETDATLQFDLKVHNDGPDSRKIDYAAHITLHLRKVDVPQLLGLYQVKEWRITGAESTGPDLSTFGDY